MSERVNFRCNMAQATAMDRALEGKEPRSDQEAACLKSGHRQLKKAIERAKEKSDGGH